MPPPGDPKLQLRLQALLDWLEQDGPTLGMSPEEIEMIQQDCELAMRYVQLYEKALSRRDKNPPK